MLAKTPTSMFSNKITSNKCLSRRLRSFNRLLPSTGIQRLIKWMQYRKEYELDFFGIIWWSSYLNWAPINQNNGRLIIVHVTTKINFPFSRFREISHLIPTVLYPAIQFDAAVCSSTWSIYTFPLTRFFGKSASAGDENDDWSYYTRILVHYNNQRSALPCTIWVYSQFRIFYFYFMIKLCILLWRHNLY